MNVRAVISDFDGTLVLRDLLDSLCALVGKETESRQLNERFHRGELRGLEALVGRINLLSGLPLGQVREVVAAGDFLRPGARELFTYLREKGIATIIASGSIVQLLDVYKEMLEADYIVGSRPLVEDGRLAGISEHEYPSEDFKVAECSAILSSLNIGREQVVALGDSPADAGIFRLAARSIAVDPKGNIAESADYAVESDLHVVIDILEHLSSQTE